MQQKKYSCPMEDILVTWTYTKKEQFDYKKSMLQLII